MANKEIVGIEKVNYSNKDGKVINGVKIYIATSLAPAGIGVSVKEEYLANRDISEFHLGEVLAVLYEPTYRNNYRCVGVLYADNKSK